MCFAEAIKLGHGNGDRLGNHGGHAPTMEIVGDLIPGYPKEEESMNHRTVKTPESAVTSLARPNGSLVPPRPSAHVPLGPALPRPTAEG